MRSRVSRWGNSLAIRIPASFAREVRIEAGEAVDVRVDDGRLVIVPARSTPTLEALVAGITDDNRHGETDWGPAVGREIW